MAGVRVEGEDDVTERINRSALDALKERLETFEAVTREETRAMRVAIEHLQDSQDQQSIALTGLQEFERLTRADLVLIKQNVVSTNDRVGRIESLLASTPVRAALGAGSGAGGIVGLLWLAEQVYNALK